MLTERQITAADVDVVTTGTFGVMSGTLAVLHIPVTAPGYIPACGKSMAERCPGNPGALPERRAGIRRPRGVRDLACGAAAYGGGHLFRDIVAGNEVTVEVESAGARFSRTVTLADMGHARLITTRSAFKNYLAVINTKPDTVQTIFSVKGLTGPYTRGIGERVRGHQPAPERSGL